MEKHSYYLLVLMFLFSFLACNSETDEIEAPQKETSEIREITVSLPEIPVINDAETRTEFVFNDDNYKFSFKWSEGDVLGVYPDAGSQIDFPIDENDIGFSTAHFDGGGWALKSESRYSLYYPYDYSYIAKDAIPLDYRKQTQLAKNDYSHLFSYNYFSSKEAVMGSASGQLNFSVGYVGTIMTMEFTMPKSGFLSKLRIRSENLPFILTANLDISGEVPVVTPITESSSYTLFLNNISVEENEVIQFFFWVLPRDFKSSNSNLKTEIVYSDREIYVVDTNPGTALEGGTSRVFIRTKDRFTKKNGLEPITISFVDKGVEAICLDNWDSNYDGELDAAEAAAVETLENVFSGTEIESFDELQYFTGLNEIEDYAFAGCSKLESVILPETVKRIGDSAFQGTALSNFIIPGHVEIIGNSAFSDCKSLLSDDSNAGDGRPENIFSEGLKVIGDYAFSGCSALYVIALPNSLESLGEGAFSGCTGLLSASLNDGLTSIKQGTFSNCYWLSVANLPSNLVEIGERAFFSCIRLNYVSLPEGFKRIDNEAFYDSGLNSIELPESLEYLGEDPFGRCTSMQWAVWKKGFETSNDIFSSYLHYPIYVRSDEIEWLKSSYPAYEERFAVMETQDGGTVISNPDMQGGW